MRRSKKELALAAILLVSAFCATGRSETTRFPPVVGDAGIFTEALAKERPATPPKVPVTGITVPHHLLAPDLIARGVWAASGNSYERIIVISPDHFRRSHRPIATTRRGFDTALGPVEVDQAAVDTLLNRPDLVDDSDLFTHEHGIAAVLPFLHFVFPDIPIVPITLGIGTDRQEWDAAVELLKNIVTPRTLIVQSTDYSHYLLPQVARLRDQETLNVIAADDPVAITDLRPSDHLDSKASQYVQMRLQQEIFHSHAVIIANRNSREYVHHDAPSTSYMVTVYATDEAALSTLTYPDQRVVYFGGDVFLGRYFTLPLLNEDARRAVIEGVRRMTAGAPLIVNLEGVIMAVPPTGIPDNRHVMDDGLAGPILKAINVMAAGLANNHSFDLGPDGLAASEKTLTARGIRPIPHMAFVDLGAFRVVAMNFIGAGDFKGYPVVRRSDRRGRPLRGGDFSSLCTSSAAPPVVALVHWGTEYTSLAGAAERNIAQELAGCGVSLVIGAHSHQASTDLEMVAGGEALMFYSLGNLLFDQISPRSTGALVELRIFNQGTFATRVIRAPNLFEDALAKD